MAKNNVKGDNFPKQDNEVVFLPNVGNQDNTGNKSLLSPAARRCMNTRSTTYQVLRSPAETPRFSNTQAKMSQLTKPSPGISAASASIPSTPRLIAPAVVKCDAVTAVGSSPVSSASSVTVQRQIKSAPASNVCQYLKRTSEERTIPIFSERTGKFLTSNPLKKEVTPVTPNGQITKQVTPQRQAPFPSDLTITPICANSQKTNIVMESPKVISKPVQIYTTAASIQSLPKTPELKEKELPAGIQLGTSVFSKEKFYANKIQENPTINSDPCFRHSIGTKVLIMTERRPTRGRPRGSRNKVIEPVCLTLSSDEEETAEESHTPCSNGATSTPSSSILLQQCPARVCLVNKHQVTDSSKKPPSEQLIKTKPLHLEADEEDEEEEEEMEEEEMDEEMVEEEEVEEEEEPLNTSVDELNHNVELVPKEITLSNSTSERLLIITCRSVRVGSFKIHPVDDKPHIEIFMTTTGFKFQVPTVKNIHEMTTIVLTESDIQTVLGHFGRCLPILFIFCEPLSGERIRKQLRMTPGEIQYFDPDGQDDRQKIITFLIDSITEDQKNFLRHFFPGEGFLKEVDQKLANEILVKSTPQHTQSTQSMMMKSSTVYTPMTHVAHVQTPVTSPVVIQTVPIKASPKVPQVTQVTKILTYPPPPQTGGIAITNEDLLCLEEGEFLNDAIIDFYLKYLMNEKLSEADRQRTHVFSTYFYHSLTKRLKAGDKALTWTKNVDIFEKDFIIIPINQNVHWFLAIICFPGLVPESQCSPSKNAEKSAESVSSTNDREACESPDLNFQINSIIPLKDSITTKDQSCSTDDQSSDEGLSNEVVSSYMEEPLPEAPDSSTHPDKHAHHEKMPCILLFDSLSRPKLCRIVKTLREYLDKEWKKKKKGTDREFSKNTMKGHITDVPQQTNFSDCGIYVLQYVESFFENPFPYFSDQMPRLPDWFPPEKVANKREEIKNVILELQKRQLSSTTNKDSKPNITRKESEKVSCNTSLQTSRLSSS